MKSINGQSDGLDIPTQRTAINDSGIETVQMTTEQVLAASREEAERIETEKKAAEKVGVLASIRRGITNLFKRAAEPASAPAIAPTALAKTVATPPPTVKLNKGTAKWAIDALNLVDTSSQRMRIVASTDDDIAPNDALSLCEKLIGDPTQGALTSALLKKNFAVPLDMARRFFGIRGLSLGNKKMILDKIDPREISDPDEIIERAKMGHLLVGLKDERLIAPTLKRFSFEFRVGSNDIDINKIIESFKEQKNAKLLLAELESVQGMEPVNLADPKAKVLIPGRIVAINHRLNLSVLLSRQGLVLVRAS